MVVCGHIYCGIRTHTCWYVSAYYYISMWTHICIYSRTRVATGNAVRGIVSAYLRTYEHMLLQRQSEDGATVGRPTTHRHIVTVAVFKNTGVTQTQTQTQTHM
jgi:hypothetical protein